MESVVKDPDAVLSYGWDWSNFGANDGASSDPGWLQGDTINTSTWTISGPDSTLIQGSDTNSTTETSVTLSGGTVNTENRVVNHITTAAGLEDDRTILVKVAQR